MNGCMTSVMTSAVNTRDKEIEVGLHQGSAISPLLFVIIIDVITEEIDEGTQSTIDSRARAANTWRADGGER